MDWCLRITAWRPLPVASCSRWLTDSEMVRRPPPRTTTKKEKPTSIIFHHSRSTVLVFLTTLRENR